MAAAEAEATKKGAVKDKVVEAEATATKRMAAVDADITKVCARACVRGNVCV